MATLSEIRFRICLSAIFIFLSTLFGIYTLNYSTRMRTHLKDYSKVYRSLWFFGEDDDPKPLLTLLTTLRDNSERELIHQNLIQNWAMLSPHVIPVLVVPESDNSTFWTYEAQQRDWKVIRTSHLLGEVPILKHMFREVENYELATPFVGYANCDILFASWLPDTLKAVLEAFADTDHPGILITGRRKNVDVMKVPDSRCFECLQNISAEIPLWRTDAEDYFIFSAPGFEFGNITTPDFVVGKHAVNNWIVGTAIASGMIVVDATETLDVLHQNTHVEELPNGDPDINHNMIPGFRPEGGHTTCAPWRTVPCHNGTYHCVTLQGRPEQDICGNRSEIENKV